MVTSAVKNGSSTAYRVLYILLLLIRYRSLSLLELNLLLFENSKIARTYNSETITKYVNTLRRVGCQIPHANRSLGFQYILARAPFPLQLNEREFDLFQCMVMEILRKKEELRSPAIDLSRRLAWGLVPEQRDTIEAMLQPTFSVRTSKRIGGNSAAQTAVANSRVAYDKSSEQPQAQTAEEEMLEQLRLRFLSYCKDNQQLSIQYEISSEEPDRNVVVEPNRLFREGECLYLLGKDAQTYRDIQLELKRISSVRQLPSKGRIQSKSLTVLFQLTGRLVQNYRPYRNEEVLISSDSSILLIRTKTDHYPNLVRRLMRYGQHCQIISPSHVRQEVKHWIDQELSLLEIESGSEAELKGSLQEDVSIFA